MKLVLTVGSIDGPLDKPALDVLVRAQVDVVIAAGLLHCPGRERRGHLATRYDEAVVS